MKFSNHIAQAIGKINRIRLLMGLDTFVMLLGGVILLAYHFPEPGIHQGAFTLQDAADWGVSLIFFFYGLKLSPRQLRADLMNWRLHFTIQASTFIIFPVVVLLLMLAFGNFGNRLFWIGTFYLAALPSTVSSSVVMVSIARGNIPSAIFNASISSLMGVFITPLWMGIWMTSGGGGYDLGDIFLKLSLQVLLPVVLGLMLNHKFGRFAHRHRSTLKWFDQIVILLIVYTSFCESFANKMFDGHSTISIFVLGIAMVALFFLIYEIVSLIGRLLRFNTEDHITAVFCGSKKSLVHGTVMSKVLLPGFAGVGVILLPLMLYHTLQLIIVSIIAMRFAKRKKQLPQSVFFRHKLYSQRKNE